MIAQGLPIGKAQIDGSEGSLLCVSGRPLQLVGGFLQAVGVVMERLRLIPDNCPVEDSSKPEEEERGGDYNADGGPTGFWRMRNKLNGRGKGEAWLRQANR